MTERKIMWVVSILVGLLAVGTLIAAFFLPEGTQCTNGVYPDGKGGVTVTVECE
jgi:hypothetical protein